MALSSPVAAQDLVKGNIAFGAGGFFRCYYNYENKGSYLEVVASGEPEPKVSGVKGSCK